MTKYTFRSKNRGGYQSSYESEGETEYKHHKNIAKGDYALAREFISISGKQVVILSPISKKIDFQEAKRKYEFFKALYPGKGTELIEDQNTYRLVVPFLPGTPLHQLSFKSEEELRVVFLSAVKALKDCHDKNIILVDLKEDNILFDSETGVSYLVDGGISSKKEEFILHLFEKGSQDLVEDSRAKLTHYAPECFSLKRELATEAMDIYSLGTMITFIAGAFLESELWDLALACQDKDPDKRPSLDSLENKLTQLKDPIQLRSSKKKGSVKEAVDSFKSFKISPKGEDIEKDLNGFCWSVSNYLKEQFNTIDEKDLSIYGAYRKKCVEIRVARLNWEKKLGYLAQINFNKHLQSFEEIAVNYAEENSKISAFHDHLKAAKYEFLESTKSNFKAKKTFEYQCQCAIKEVEPLLNNYRSLRDRIVQFIAEVLAVLTCGLSRRIGFFDSKTSAAAELEIMQEELLTVNL